MVTAVTYPNENCFIGNPMLVGITANSADEVTLTLKINGQPDVTLSLFPYSQSGVYKGAFYLSGLLEAAFKDIYIPQGSIISDIEDFTVSYTVEVGGYSGASFTGTAFWGGVDNTNYSRLKRWGWDMFIYRLKNYTRQFLFTTRTNSVHLRLRETELYPFIFIHPGTPVSFVTSNGRVIIPEVFPEGTVCVMDIYELRATFKSLYSELPSFFAVQVDGETVFDITLLPGSFSEEVYTLRFKNSLGGYEDIEVTGKALRTYEMSEENTWQSQNQDNYFEEHRDRVVSKEGLTVHTGYKSQDEHAFILDMVKSNEIYLIYKKDVSQMLYRCHVSVENYEYLQVIREPNSIQLKIRFVTEEKFVSPEIDLTLSTGLYENITRPGAPQWRGDGFIHGGDNMLYGQ
ncbi:MULTISPECIES: hypothetical protein [unclassified Dysgonomonas]|uniref:hypothetical protein n=1 Tax=unclassified Dysgonomonas TaxID=2630389 RepID=UPI0025BE8AA5|nr:MULTISPECIES: hypothetical protein [unclassified Dysgonomonas]HMM02055.1 hypothetical protein [Dysgonomonas sp.]